jgi:hypothetical protein
MVLTAFPRCSLLPLFVHNIVPSAALYGLNQTRQQQSICPVNCELQFSALAPSYQKRNQSQKKGKSLFYSHPKKGSEKGGPNISHTHFTLLLSSTHAFSTVPIDYPNAAFST